MKISSKMIENVEIRISEYYIIQGLQIWRVAASILNKQFRTADRGWLYSVAVVRGTNSLPP
jgi:hypothetical protein